MWLLAGVAALLVGAAFVIGSRATLEEQRHVRANWKRASGTVVALHEESTSDASVYCPVVEFLNANGVSSRFVGQYGTRPATHKVGQSLPVLYDPQTGHAQLELASDWSLAGPQLAFGLLFLTLGTVFVFMYWREG